MDRRMQKSVQEKAGDKIRRSAVADLQIHCVNSGKVEFSGSLSFRKRGQRIFVQRRHLRLCPRYFMTDESGLVIFFAG